jgi:hypothetical protein
VLWVYVDLYVVILFCIVGVCGFLGCDLVLCCGWYVDLYVGSCSVLWVYVDLHLFTNPDHKLLFVAKLSVWIWSFVNLNDASHYCCCG